MTLQPWLVGSPDDPAAHTLPLQDPEEMEGILAAAWATAKILRVTIWMGNEWSC